MGQVQRQERAPLEPTFEALVHALVELNPPEWLIEWATREGAEPRVNPRGVAGEQILRIQRKAEERIRILEAELSLAELETSDLRTKVSLLLRELWRTRQQLDEAKALAESRQELIEQLRSDLELDRRIRELGR